MASTRDEAKDDAVIPPDAFKYLNSIKLHQPQFLGKRFARLCNNFKYIPPPGHRVMLYKAKLEHERILSRLEKAYRLPSYWPGCFKELLQWLHRIDFTQDNQIYFNRFLGEIMEETESECSIPLLQTRTHDFFLVWESRLSMMNTPYATRSDEETTSYERRTSYEETSSDEEASSDEETIENKCEEHRWLIHEFNPALQVERNSDTEEPILPLRFGLPVGRVTCFKKGKGKDHDGYSSFHLVFHPVDKSFWMVVDRYLGWERFGECGSDVDVHSDTPVYEYLDNKERNIRLRLRFGRRNNMAGAEAFRLGSADLWFPKGLGLSELDAGKLVSRSDRRHRRPAVDFSSLPKVSRFRDSEAPQIHIAEDSSFQSYLAENGVVKGRSWLSVSPLPA
ncbi:hypothetical protein Z517_06060 [Fonsecaea pedrosoi CBS 271.37]|uniref:Unplaced genomic scaffold supercont1.4, whole genome shotgun sequence n=1 Tax=Fonsecaea pedrosoi CBS 271.37 TaxID=1442368 RepID=A0A0D2GF68_9EURO|nr:uncharacterized protein Z517_06060 [Fonsecaea pedrosoi CBS 271.37]KIW79448.1 hypothetical protein Z517_06060 [Fonsecaea pedrosoi CBS 271.37]